ncbi:MAG TPA: response regulator [Methanocorpusculum sp.]|nr:response regulator [Methanocorpusculum sp.]
MKEKSSVRKPGRFLFLVCILLVIATLIFGSISTVTTLSDNLRKEHLNSFEATVDQSAQTLSITVSSTKEYARLLSRAFETDYKPGTDLTSYAASRVDDANLLNGIIICIDSAGNIYSTASTHTGTWKNTEMLASSEKETVLIDYLTNPPDSKYLLVFERLEEPVKAKYHDRTVDITHVGVGRSIPYINSIYTATFPVSADTFLLSTDGTQLSAVYGLGTGVKGDVFLSGDYSGMEIADADAQAIAESVEMDASASCLFSVDGKEYAVFMSRVPGLDAWAVVIVKPADLDAALQSSIGNLFGLMILFVILVAAVGVFLTYFVVRSRRDRAVIAEQALQNQYLLHASRAKSVFLFNMSHDVRTPMNAILGYTNIALKNIDDKEKVEDALEKTRKSGTVLLSLLNNILDVSRVESGKATVAEDKGDFLLSFVNIQHELKMLASERYVALSFEFGRYTDRYVICDFERCNRVLENIISNALMFTSPGGWVKVFAEQLDRYEGGKGVYRYTVEDNGIGMSEEFQEHMYEEFTREQASTLPATEGTGLGLSIAKAFVDLMGGKITCLSKQGIGTKFTVDLPFVIQKGEEFVVPKEEEVSHEGDTSALAGKRVLVVEDDEMNREIAVDILSDAGMEVESAEDGSLAVWMLKTKGPTYYDFVLMDIQMPVMDGYEATRMIRRMSGFERLPIIAVSANAFEEDKAASFAAGMDDHVPKPIDVQLLMQTMVKYFR